MTTLISRERTRGDADIGAPACVARACVALRGYARYWSIWARHFARVRSSWLGLHSGTLRLLQTHSCKLSYITNQNSAHWNIVSALRMLQSVPWTLLHKTSWNSSHGTLRPTLPYTPLTVSPLWYRLFSVLRLSLLNCITVLVVNGASGCGGETILTLRFAINIISTVEVHTYVYMLWAAHGRTRRYY